jgi:hypothetical protein
MAAWRSPRVIIESAALTIVTTSAPQKAAHQQKETERQDHDWQGQDCRDGAHERIDGAEDQGDSEQREPSAGGGHARDDARGHPQRGGVDQETAYELHSS